MILISLHEKVYQKNRGNAYTLPFKMLFISYIFVREPDFYSGAAPGFRFRIERDIYFLCRHVAKIKPYACCLFFRSSKSNAICKGTKRLAASGRDISSD